MARDIYHYIVKEALEADGWTITQDPFILKSGGVRMEIDLAAEQTVDIDLMVFNHQTKTIVQWIIN